jgi:hypothetical protein
MGPAEAVDHARRSTAARTDALMWSVARPAWRRRWEPASARLLAGETLLREPIGFLTRERASLLRERTPDAARVVVARAQQRLDGEIAVLGYPPFELAPTWDGVTDPVSGQRWPDRHGRLIDFRHSMPGDPKLIWELHRCQELPLLVLASLIDGDERFAHEARRRLLGWLQRHPPGRGIPWANAFEPGLRALSFAIAFDGLRGVGGLDPSDHLSVLRGLWQHARWIERGLSRHSSANNHLVGELLGLLAIGLLAPELAQSERWSSSATAEIALQAELQVLKDGAGAEQAFAYHVFLLDMLLIATALLDARGRTVPAAVVEALDRAGRALALLVDDDEPDPAFGDADNGRALDIDGRDCVDARTVAASIAARLGHPGARRVARRPDARVSLLFGRAGLERFAATPVEARPASGILPDAGIVVLRFAGQRALFDVGALGYLSIAAHGHADGLSVVLSDGPQDLVVDPGTGSYRNPAIRSWFRGTGSHPTVAVDGLDQSEQGGPFLWVRHRNARLCLWDSERLVAVGACDGPGAGHGRALHRRAVAVIDRRALLVVDRLEAGESHTALQSWPLHPSLDIEQRSPRLVEASLDGAPRLQIAYAATGPAVTSVDREGWWSRRLEAWEPAPRTRQRASWVGVVHLGALLVVPSGSTTIPTLLLEEDGGVLVARVSIEGVERTVALSLGSEPPVVELGV